MRHTHIVKTKLLGAPDVWHAVPPFPFHIQTVEHVQVTGLPGPDRSLNTERSETIRKFKSNRASQVNFPKEISFQESYS